MQLTANQLDFATEIYESLDLHWPIDSARGLAEWTAIAAQWRRIQGILPTAVHGAIARLLVKWAVRISQGDELCSPPVPNEKRPCVWNQIASQLARFYSWNKYCRKYALGA